MIWDSVYLLLLLGYSENDRDADVITGKGLFQVTLNIDISENGVLVRGLTLRAILKLQKAIKNKKGASLGLRRYISNSLISKVIKA